MTLVVTEEDGSVATVTLNRPEKLNALSLALETELRATFTRIARRDDLRAVILTGAGRAFSVGVDLEELGADVSGRDDRHWHGAHSLAQIIRDCGVPVISAVNGFAVTGGLELALCGDFLIASEAARFADTHARVGITPSWGLSQVLPRLIGLNRARQMSLTGAFIDAPTALAWGLVNEVLPAEKLLPRARALAAEIAETDRATMDKLRGLMAQTQEMGWSAGLATEAQVFDAHIGSLTPERARERRALVQERGRRVAGAARQGGTDDAPGSH